MAEREKGQGKIGILGGTFDPVHLGHLIIAEEARAQLGLERVMFIPTGRPWLRPEQPVASAEHRLAMVRLAVQDNLAFAVSSIEVDRPGPSYTVDTLEELRRQQGPEAQFYLILGHDSLRQLPRWKDSSRLLTLCTLVVAPRQSQDGGSGRKPAGTVFLRTPLIGISATEIRRRIAVGEPVRYWVSAVVEEYIRTHNLYREGRG
ncbi:MAG: nicotinate-nucleotide adenylyltransferase [Chloroflexi bacterium]|nr:nicotinate-nucleotide adenylyltransferase [Chloroflexota bacterium]